MPRLEQELGQGCTSALQKRLAAGDFHQWNLEAPRLRSHILDGASVAFIKGIFRVTVGAAEVAAGKADEDAREAGVG